MLLTLTLTDLLVAWVILILFLLMKNARQCLEEETVDKGFELVEQIIIIVPSISLVLANANIERWLTGAGVILVALQVPRNLGLGEFSPFIWRLVDTCYAFIRCRQERSGREQAAHYVYGSKEATDLLHFIIQDVKLSGVVLIICLLAMS